MRILLLAGAALTMAAAGLPASNSLDALLARYAQGEFQVLERAITSEREFERLRDELGFEDKFGQRTGAIAGWHEARQRVHAVFMLEFALAGLNRRYKHWLDVVDQARRFVVARPNPPGDSPSEDAFELDWHKTAVALLFGQRPDYVEDYGLTPLATRLAASPVSGEARLVEPWYALALGMVEEQWIRYDPAAAATRGAAAVARYEVAASSPATRAEALVRQGRVLLELRRIDDTLAAFERLRQHPETDVDLDVRYWGWLLHGRALMAAGRLDDAAHALEEAARTVPGAQAPLVALMAVEQRRDRPERALEWARDVRSAPGDVADPWWHYQQLDFRHFRSRLVHLRRSIGP